METSLSNLVASGSLAWPLTLVAIGSAAMAAAILVWFLAFRPQLTTMTKLVLLLGLGVLPAATGISGNLAGFENMKERSFCGSCHVMTPYTEDLSNPASQSLAAMHARNPMFGGQACYICHSDYGMFGTINTKLGGVKHVLHYYTKYRTMTIEDALPKMHLYSPFPNNNCMQCHSTSLPAWNDIVDHAGLLEDLRSEKVSCASDGCHGPSHPFSKVAGHPKLNEPKHVDPRQGVKVPPYTPPIDAGVDAAPNNDETKEPATKKPGTKKSRRKKSRRKKSRGKRGASK